MPPRKIFISLGLALVLMLTSAPAFAGPPERFPPPGMRPMMGPSGLTGDKQHLYVLTGAKIMQYSLADAKLLKTVDLPQPAVPKEKEAMRFPPPLPPRGGHQAIWAGEGVLYVLAGPLLYRYSTPDLTLKATVELLKPEPPKAGN